eukprot:PhM_4_TR18611/c0_g1_i1/m.83758
MNGNIIFYTFLVFVVGTALHATGRVNAVACGGVHDATLTDFVESLTNPKPDFTTASRAAITETTRIGIAEFYSPSSSSTTIGSNNNVFAFPVGMTPLCLAMGGGHSSPVATIEMIAAYVTGTAGAVAGQTSPVRVYLPPPNSGAAHALLSSLKALGAVPSSASYPATTNTTAVYYSTISEAQAGLVSNPYAVAIVSALGARGLRMQCASITLPPTNEGCSKTVSPMLNTAALSQMSIDASTFSLSFDVKEISVYPLAGPIVVLVHKSAAEKELADACTGNFARTADVVEFVERLMTSDETRTLLLRYGAVGISDGSLYSARASLHMLMPTPALTHILTGGSSAIMPVIHAEATPWYSVAPTDFIDYPGGGSGAGLRGQREGTWVMSGSDIALSQTEWDARPSLKQVPGVALSVSLIHGITGIDDLVLPACVVNDIYRGVVKYWDEERIQAVNTLVTLPHLPITVVVRDSKSGTTEIFLTGLKLLDENCRGDASDAVVSGVWPYNNSVVRASSGSLPDVVRDTPGAISYITTPSDGASKVASLWSDKFGRTGPARSDVLLGLIKADLDENTLEVTLRSENAAYPFVGVSYLIYDADRPGNCTELKRALEFALWMLQAQAAIDTINSLRYVPVPENFQEAAVKQIRSARCGGVPLYPVITAESDDDSSLLIYIIIGVVVSLVLIAGSLYAIIAVRAAAINKFAPRAPPLCLILTDIESSTKLWQNYPTKMPQAVALHHQVIRRLIKEYNCYEVKTVGDAFLIAAPSVLDGVLLATDIQMELFSAEWPEDFDVQKVVGGDDNPDVWNGIRVRIGVHHCTNVTVKFDPVHQRYDYFGGDVNLTGRVEGSGRGGMVQMTKESLHVLEKHPDYANLVEGSLVIKLAQRDVEVQGVEDPVTFFSVMPEELAARVFQGLEVAATTMDFDTHSNQSNQSSRSTFYGGGGNGPLKKLISHVIDECPKKGMKDMLASLCQATGVAATKSMAPRRQKALVIQKLTQTFEAENLIGCGNTASGLRRRSSLRSTNSMSASMSLFGRSGRTNNNNNNN